MRRKISRDRARQRADARLQEDVCRELSVFLRRFRGERRISLHDPERDLRVAVERRVLHQHPALLLCHRRRMAHRIIVVVCRERGLCAEAANVREALGRAALGHKNVCKETEQLRRPCNAAPVIAVRRRDEDDIAETLAVRRLLQVLIGHLALGQTQILREITRHGITRPEGLERMPPDAKRCRKPHEICERGRLIPRNSPMELCRTRGGLLTECRDIG